MNNDIVDILKEIIKNQHNIFKDERKLKSILKDYFPENKKIQNQLYMVVEEGIVEDMQSSSDINKFRMIGYIRSLSSDYGISEIMAKEGIMLWAKAFEKSIEDVKVDDNKTYKQDNTNMIDYSEVSLSDYKDTGMIYRFSGDSGKVLPNIDIKAGMYIVKSDCSDFGLIVDVYDHNKKCLGFVHKKGYQEGTLDLRMLDLSQPVMIQVKCNKQWEFTLIEIN